MKIANIKNSVFYFKRNIQFSCPYLLDLLQDDEDVCNNTKCADCYLDMELSKAFFMRKAL